MQLSHLHQEETVTLKLCIYQYRNVYELASKWSKLFENAAWYKIMSLTSSFAK